MKLADLKRVIGLDKKHKDTPHRAESNEPSQNIEDYEDEAASFVEGEQAVIRGVKRPVVLGIGVTLIVTFLIGIFWGMSSDDAEVPEKQHETKVMSQNELNSLQPDEEQLSRLRQYEQNDKASQQKDVQQPQQVKKLQQSGSGEPREAEDESYRRTQYQALPVIPQAQRYSPLPSYAALQPQPAPDETKDVSAGSNSLAAQAKDMFGSAIAFALKTQPSSDENSATAVSGINSQTANNTSMNTYIPISETMLQAGTLIPAMLLTGINTDAGDIAQAQITADIYDSLTGNNLLIPAGSKVLGTYKAGSNGRINIDWQTLIIPDSGSWNIGNSMTAVDNMGYSGLKGHVNSHTGKVLSSGAISTGLAAVAGIAGGNSSVSSNNSYSYGQLAAQGAMANFLNTASALFQKNINAAETITIEPGYQFNIFVTQAISF